jgi:acetate kinase
VITIKILVINLGSSSLKYKFFDFEDKENCLLEGHVDGIGQDRCKTIYKFDGKTVEDPKMIKNPKEAIKLALKSLLKLKIIESWKEIDAIGHRVVHGGDYFKEAALLNNSALSYIKIFSDLAPLHNPIH